MMTKADYETIATVFSTFYNNTVINAIEEQGLLSLVIDNLAENFSQRDDKFNFDEFIYQCKLDRELVSIKKSKRKKIRNSYVYGDDGVTATQTIDRNLTVQQMEQAGVSLNIAIPQNIHLEPGGSLAGRVQHGAVEFIPNHIFRQENQQAVPLLQTDVPPDSGTLPPPISRSR